MIKVVIESRDAIMFGMIHIKNTNLFMNQKHRINSKNSYPEHVEH